MSAPEPRGQPVRDLVVAGASAGGITALSDLIARLPGDLGAPVLVVVHVPAHRTSVLPNILSRAGRLPALHPEDGETARAGRIYIAPPDRHMLVRDGRIALVNGPRENHHRPAIDALFRSAALEYGRRAIGLLLSGTLDDGTAGLFALKAAGAVTAVQDPDEAAFPDMPLNALAQVKIDHRAPTGQLGTIVSRLVGEPVEPVAKDTGVLSDIEGEYRISANEANPADLSARSDTPSVFSCPDCDGVLQETEDGGMLRFRCVIGHAYGAQTLMSEQLDGIDGALMAALRALEENAALADRMAKRARSRGHQKSAAQFDGRATEMWESAAQIRDAI
jgi:two-component system, chemotaxis family, protein-glutamate methylesterase/glutaminase